MVEYDQSTAQRREIEIRRQRREQLEAQGLKQTEDFLRSSNKRQAALLKLDDETAKALIEKEATEKHIKNLEKLRDWEAGTDPERAAATQLEIDEVRRQWRARKHGGNMTTTETQGLFIDQSDWDKATSGGWSSPPVMPFSPTPGWLAEVQPNNSRGGFTEGKIILVFDTDESNDSYHAPMYIGITGEKNAMYLLRRIADAIGLDLGDLNVGFATGEAFSFEEGAYPCLITWREYEGKVQVEGALSLDTEGL